MKVEIFVIINNHEKVLPLFLNNCKENTNPPPFVVGSIKKLESEITLFTNHIKNI